MLVARNPAHATPEQTQLLIAYWQSCLLPGLPRSVKSWTQTGWVRQSPVNGEERPDEGAQKHRQRSQEEAEIVAGGGKHGVAAVAVASFEIIAIHAVLGFEVADDQPPREPASASPPNSLVPAAGPSPSPHLAVGTANHTFPRPGIPFHRFQPMWL